MAGIGYSLRERLRAQLMFALHRAGQRAEARTTTHAPVAT
jgi:hypothetical protein